MQASARLRTCTRGGSASLTGAELSNQFSATNRLELCNDAIKDGLTLNRMRAGIPKLSITGSRNDLEYYSSDGEEEHGLGGLGGESGGGLMMAMRAGRRFTGGSLGNNLRSRKAGLIIPPCALPSANVDVLGSIMNEQERWMTISNPRNISKIKIHQDGRLEYEGEGSTPRRSVAGRQAAADVAASNESGSTAGGGGGVGSGNSVQGATSNTSTGTANGSPATNTTGSGSVVGGVSQGGASTSNGESAGGANATLSSGYPDIRTAAARKAPPAPDLKVAAASEKTETGELVLSMQRH